MTYMPFQKGLWNLYVGFNAESRGEYNVSDAQIMARLGDENQWNADKINKVLQGIVIKRIEQNWLRNIRNMPEKIYSMVNPGPIPYWAVDQSKIVNKDRIYKMSGRLSWINWGVLIISLGAWVIWITKKRIRGEDVFAFSMVGTAFAYLIIHSYLFEVQGRYGNHLWIILFVFFPVSCRSLGGSLTGLLFGNKRLERTGGDV